MHGGRGARLPPAACVGELSASPPVFFWLPLVPFRPLFVTPSTSTSGCTSRSAAPLSGGAVTAKMRDHPLPLYHLAPQAATFRHGQLRRTSHVGGEHLNMWWKMGPELDGLGQQNHVQSRTLSQNGPDGLSWCLGTSCTHSLQHSRRRMTPYRKSKEEST